MKRIFVWIVFVAVLLGLVKLAAAVGNPWSTAVLTRPQSALAADGIPPSAAALWIPGCKDKPSCS